MGMASLMRGVWSEDCDVMMEVGVASLLRGVWSEVRGAWSPIDEDLLRTCTGLNGSWLLLEAWLEWEGGEWLLGVAACLI